MSIALLVGPLTVALSGLPATAAVAAPGSVTDVTNTETVQARLDPTGKVTEARVYEQIAVTGNGLVEIVNPVSTAGLRNLDGFGSFDVEAGSMVHTVDVDGRARLRSVSDYTQDLPLAVEVTYQLDGNTVAPSKVVGANGDLAVTYKVANRTAAKQTISYDDGTGKQVTEDVDVVIPMVGSLTTTLPGSFTDVQTQQANVAGDGRGGTRLTFTMTLFPPIGSDTAEFGYTAKVRDGVVPPASVSALPVQPLRSPSFKAGAESYAGGAETGAQLTAGAMEIDSNLLRLRDGASELLAGLVQLRDGAEQLRAGLAGKAAPGAEQLADGAAQLDAGAGRLEDGLSQAESRAPALVAGLTQVDGGLAKVDAGLAQLYDGIGQLPAKAKPLHDGITALRAGIGTKTADGTLLFAIDQLRQQLGQAATGLGTMAEGVYNNSSTAPGSYQRLSCAVKVLTDTVNGAGAGADACYPGGARPPMPPMGAAAPVNAAVVGGVRDELKGSLPRLYDPANPSSQATLYGGLTTIQGKLQHGAVPALVKVECGLDNTALLDVCDKARPGLLQGLSALDAGVTQLVGGVVSQVQAAVGDADDTQRDSTLRGGVHSLSDGVEQIALGGSTLISGLVQLSDGAGQLKDGTGRLADGADELAGGLGDAADGSEQLADGLVEAAEGAPQIVDGAGRLSEEGMGPLTEAGKGTAQEFGAKYALIEAVNERAATDGMAFGAPEGARGLTAYSLELAGEDGEADRNAIRGAGALAIFTLGTGIVVGLRNRFF